MKNRESASPGCPFIGNDEVVLSTNRDYLSDMRINPLAPSPNMRRVTPPQEQEHGERFVSWFAPDDELKMARDIRAAAYIDTPNQVLYTKNNDPAIRAASEQLLDLQAHYLAEHFPDFYSIENTDEFGEVITNKITDDKFSLKPSESELHPLTICGLLGQEDICIVKEKKNGEYVLVAGFLATPTGWNLSDFINRNMDQIHQDVDGYNERLKVTVDRSLASLPQFPERQIARNNVFLERDPTLALAPGTRSQFEPTTIRNAGNQLFIRSERETLTRLPSTDEYPNNDKYIIFTIKPHVYSLEITASLRAEDLSAALGSNAVLNSYKHSKKAQKYLEEITSFTASDAV
jgi:hypothetical protein